MGIVVEEMALQQVSFPSFLGVSLLITILQFPIPSNTEFEGMG
jgi:hypothetical protein